MLKDESKTPEYLPHDLAHIAWDVFESDFLKNLSKDIFVISKLYENHKKELLNEKFFSDTRVLYTHVGNAFLKAFIPESFSRQDDAVYDLVSLCANPDKTITIDVPESLIVPVYDLEYKLISYKPGDPERQESEQQRQANKEQARHLMSQVIKKVEQIIKVKKVEKENKETESSTKEGDSTKTEEDSAVEEDFLPSGMKGKAFIMELF